MHGFRAGQCQAFDALLLNLIPNFDFIWATLRQAYYHGMLAPPAHDINIELRLWTFIGHGPRQQASDFDYYKTMRTLLYKHFSRHYYI